MSYLFYITYIALKSYNQERKNLKKKMILKYLKGYNVFSL